MKISMNPVVTGIVDPDELNEMAGGDTKPAFVKEFEQSRAFWTIVNILSINLDGNPIGFTSHL